MQVNRSLHEAARLAQALQIDEQCLGKGTEVMRMDEMDKEQLTKVIVELIKDDQGVRQAVLHLVCTSPNVVTRI